MQGRIKQMINGKDQEIITINKTGNSILNNAKYSADNTDEWYTTYETIAEELSHYKNQFIDKVVLCNCDDPFESNFCYYFLRHFNQLKLKKLICTSYSGSKIDQLVNGQLTLDLLDADGNPVINNKHGYVLTITQIPGEHGKLLHLLVDQPLFFFRNVKLHLYISLSVFHFRTAFRYKGLGLSQQAFSANGYSFAVLAIYSIPPPKGGICCAFL
jgi:hypothetical protein